MGAYGLDAESDDMTGPQAWQSVQFVTVKGKRMAVLDATDWAALVE